MTVLAANLLLTVNLLAAMVWTGGLVAVAVAAVAARAELPPRDQVRFFRALGRRYGVVSGVALLVFSVTGAIRAGNPSSWTDREYVIAALTLAVAALTLVGVRNARRVQVLRSQSLAGEAEGRDVERLRRAVRAATMLRAAIALTTLATLVAATV